MKYNINKLFQHLTMGVLSVSLLASAKAQVTIVDNGKSTFKVVIPGDAPPSVLDAAQELQKSIEVATGVTLPIQKEEGKVSSPVISVGNTSLATAAGVVSSDIDEDGYRIITQGDNLYILGIDTPEGSWAKGAGTSNGTANGVYTFLEDYLDVRWLMPGDIGRDVPKKSTFKVGKISRTETPLFHYRRMPYLDGYANPAQRSAINRWMDIHRVGKQAGPVAFSAGHNWWSTVNRAFGESGSSESDTDAVEKLYEQHPDWFAMDATGERPLPKSKYDKFETTNPELVEWFARQAIESMKSGTRPYPYSLSPSDGQRWSQSPESKALYDPAPPNIFDPETPRNQPGTSSLVLKWYHDVAQIVAKEYPEGKLSGYIYSSFLYPPTKFAMKLPENFIPMIAPSFSYGYGLHHSEAKKLFKDVMGEWSKVAPENWYYYDLPNLIIRQDRHKVGDAKFHGTVANVTPPATDILDFIFPTLLESHIKGATLYGSPVWSSSALTNYLLAKMMWNPRLKASDIQKEWLHRAYGPEAGRVMEEFYTVLNDQFRDYYQSSASRYESYEFTDEIIKNIYQPIYPQLEKLLFEAKMQPISELQKKRFQLIEDNLVVLQWRLRNGGYLKADFSSPLQRSDAQISHLVAAENKDFPLFPGVLNSELTPPAKPRPLPWKVLLSDKEPAKGKSTLPKWKDNQFLFYAVEDGEIRIKPEVATHDIYFAAYEIVNAKGVTVASGVFNTEETIVMAAKAGEAYLLTIPLRKPSNFQLQVENAVLASGHLSDGNLILSGDKAPVYVFYISGDSPLGAFDDEDGVRIRKPYSSKIAQGYMESRYIEARSYPLDEGWLFSSDPQNDGLERGVIKADFDDSNWTPMSPLNWWQVQGPKFSDYHGPAWYRIKFQGKALKEGEAAALYFGAVDGNAVVYLNGKKIKEHTLGPNHEGWDRAFASRITSRMLPGENTLAVQVTSKNSTSASGIFKGVTIVVGKRK